MDSQSTSFQVFVLFHLFHKKERENYELNLENVACVSGQAYFTQNDRMKLNTEINKNETNIFAKYFCGFSHKVTKLWYLIKGNYFIFLYMAIVYIFFHL